MTVELENFRKTTKVRSDLILHQRVLDVIMTCPHDVE